MVELVVPNIIRDIIEEVVRQDEGGWFLNKPDANDIDGSWTFGGITSTLYNKFYMKPEDVRKISRETILDICKNEDTRKLLIDDCIIIYYNEFIIPIQHHLGEVEVYEDQFSCAINLGMEVFKQLHSNLIKDDPHAEFCERWKDYYIHLVVENAKAWKAYATSLEDAAGKDYHLTVTELKAQRPKSLRAIYLVGWLNRVARYS